MYVTSFNAYNNPEHAEVQNVKEKSAVTWQINGESEIQIEVYLTPVATCLPHYLHHLSLYQQALSFRGSKNMPLNISKRNLGSS